jgi:hypothetical protein
MMTRKHMLIVLLAGAACGAPPAGPPVDESAAASALRAIETVDGRSSGSDEDEKPEPEPAPLCSLDVEKAHAEVFLDHAVVRVMLTGRTADATEALHERAAEIQATTRLDMNGVRYEVATQVRRDGNGLTITFTPERLDYLDEIAALLRDDAHRLHRDAC